MIQCNHRLIGAHLINSLFIFERHTILLALWGGSPPGATLSSVDPTTTTAAAVVHTVEYPVICYSMTLMWHQSNVRTHCVLSITNYICVTSIPNLKRAGEHRPVGVEHMYMRGVRNLCPTTIVHCRTLSHFECIGHVICINSTFVSLPRDSKWKWGQKCSLCNLHICVVDNLITRFMGPTWGPPGADRTQVGPRWATWTLLSGKPQAWWGILWSFCIITVSKSIDNCLI